MDGGFLDLDAETIEAELDEYWREIYKIHKVIFVCLSVQLSFHLITNFCM